MFKKLLKLIQKVVKYSRKESRGPSRVEPTTPKERVLEQKAKIPPLHEPAELEQKEKISQAERLPKRKVARAKLVNIGIDFGTSSTKVFMRDITARHVYACAFPDALGSFGPFCWPSTIRIDSGRLYFGTPAESMNSGRAIRSFKICLACQHGLFRKEDCPTNQCLGDGDKFGEFNLIGTDSQKTTFQPWELASLYLANLIDILASEFVLK